MFDKRFLFNLIIAKTRLIFNKILPTVMRAKISVGTPGVTDRPGELAATGNGSTTRGASGRFGTGSVSRFDGPATGGCGC